MTINPDSHKLSAIDERNRKNLVEHGLPPDLSRVEGHESHSLSIVLNATETKQTKDGRTQQTFIVRDYDCGVEFPRVYTDGKFSRTAKPRCLHDWDWVDTEGIDTIVERCNKCGRIRKW